MSDEINVKTKSKKLKIFIIIAAIVIALITCIAVIFAVSRSAKAKKVEAQLSLGEKYLSELEYEQAIAAYELAIEIDPKNADAYLGLAEVYISMGDYEKAEEVLEKAKEKVKEADLGRMQRKLDDIESMKKILVSDSESESSGKGGVEPTTNVTPTAIPQPTQVPKIENDRDRFVFREEGDGSLTICFVLDKQSKIISIPSEIDGKVVKTIDSYAFNNCDVWERIEIPATITCIKESTFIGCNGINALVVDSNNPKYTSQDSQGQECNVIIDKETGTLIRGGGTNVIIPESVRCIGIRAFSGCKNLVEIDWRNGTEQVGDEAFFGCILLERVILPETVTQIGRLAFSACDNLSVLRVEEGNSKYSSKDFNGKECNAIIDRSTQELIVGCSSTVIPEGVTQIGWGAFWHCHNLKSIRIPESVTVINGDAFLGCTGLSEIFIPASVSEMRLSPFNVCDKLVKIEVDTENQYFSSYEGALFNKERTVLIQAPYGELNYMVPNGVTSIGNNAFWGNESVQKIEISEGVTRIGFRAFCNCKNLTEIVIPSSVSEFDMDVFLNCEKVTIITSPGSFAEQYAKEKGIVVKYQ